MAREVRTYSNDEVLVDKRREHIADQAVKVFLDKGYQAATTRELAESCAMAPGTLYYYIGAKEDILHLICLRSLRSVEEFEQFRDSLGDISAMETLCSCIRKYFEWSDRDQDRLIFFNHEISWLPRDDKRLVLQGQVDIVHFFEKLLIEGIKGGEFQMNDPLLVAHDILMKGHDWGLRRWFLREHFTLKDYTEKHVELIIRAIRKDTEHGTSNNEDKGN